MAIQGGIFASGMVYRADVASIEISKDQVRVSSHHVQIDPSQDLNTCIAIVKAEMSLVSNYMINVWRDQSSDKRVTT